RKRLQAPSSGFSRGAGDDQGGKEPQRVNEAAQTLDEGSHVLTLVLGAAAGPECGFFPAILYLLMNNLSLGAGIWLAKAIIQSLFIGSFAGRAGVKLSGLHLFLFEFYYLTVSWCTIVYYFWPSSISWKERKYE